MFGKTRIGIMGTGNIASVMAATLKKQKGVKLYAVGSRTQERADEFAKNYGAAKAYGSYADLAADPKVELIYVATPHSEHFENVKLCITNNKPVLCEKAFMLNERQAKTIFDYARDKNVYVCEAMWTRFMPFMSTIKEVLGSGIIGEPTMLTANLGYNIIGKQRITSTELGGGALLDVGVYTINFASMIFGDEIADISSIASYAETHVDVQDSITLRYKNGKMAVLNCSALSKSDRQGVIYGTNGYMIIENINNFESLSVYNNENKKTAFYKRPGQISGYEYEVAASIKAIKEGWLESPMMPHNETLKMLNIMDFVRKQIGVHYAADEVTKITLSEEAMKAEMEDKVTVVEAPKSEEIVEEAPKVEEKDTSSSETTPIEVKQDAPNSLEGAGSEAAEDNASSTEE